ncbi:hypothetical protein [Tenacibaculum sp. M341]|uniref:hypothetical protein n=1 Tax=Tenacibaculum sp. M341 TaxID=2530339 RepID=UPI0014045660|nr:hypothetical protein [Tenacibaculum sp. M341]
MKKVFLIALLCVSFSFISCEEQEKVCQGEVTTFTLPDGTTRTIEQPCFDFD